MTIQYIRDYYNLTVKIGDYITFTGQNAARRGKVISAPRQYLRVRFDDTGDYGYPDWPIRFTEAPYREDDPAVEIDVPEHARLIDLNGDDDE